MYDNGLDVFSFGVMGENLDDIGHSMANFCRLKWPDLNPQLVVDVGCTIGHNTVPWKQTFPHAEVHGLDVAPLVFSTVTRAEALVLQSTSSRQPAMPCPMTTPASM